MKELIKKFTSRSFIIFAVSVFLLTNNSINVAEFLAINGINYGGSALKDVTSKKRRMRPPLLPKR